jgi:hypothetical protein
MKEGSTNQEGPDRGIWVPIISDILGREIGRGKVLIGLFEPAAFTSDLWAEASLTLAPSQAVGGEVVPINMTSLVAPWIALTIMVALVAAGVCVFARRLVTKHN